MQNGRYGPYLKMGTDSRSLETEAQLLTVTLEDWRSLPSRSAAVARPHRSRRCATWVPTPRPATR